MLLDIYYRRQTGQENPGEEVYRNLSLN